VIRAYRKNDYDAVVALVTTVLAEYGFAAHIGGVQSDLAAIEEGYGKGGFWVAEIDGAVAGTVAIRPKSGTDKTCELKRLYVNKSFRGTGVGRALYEHAEAFARGAGYDRIWLDSSRKFTEARRLYEKNGFVLLDELANEWCDNVYEKRLTGA
jgi:GNAT superfamily N-acetyltransferase